MAYLINRNPPARAHCLYALCKLACEKFPDSDATFRMFDLKYDQNSTNIHQFCSILKTDEDLGISFCRYKENPLSPSGCGLTNGVEEDSTKSKEISNTVNALHALGFFHRTGNMIRITQLGRTFANSYIDSKEFYSIFRQGALNSGLMIGLLGKLYLTQKQCFKTDELYIGYPNTGHEKVHLSGENIIVSCGSEKDSNTRTKSCLLAWGITAGFFFPTKLSRKSQNELNDYTLSKARGLKDYSLLDFPHEIFQGKFLTAKPLDYNNLTKNTGALRENNQQKIRSATLSLEPKIKNRRLAILLTLHRCYLINKCLNLQELIKYLLYFEDLFVVDKDSFEAIMYEEINIGFVAGIPFEIDEDEQLKPMTGLELSELLLGAPKNVVAVIKEFKV